MTKVKQRYTVATLATLVALLVLCLAWIPTQGIASAASDFSNASSDKATGYFMEIPLAGETGKFKDANGKSDFYQPLVTIGKGFPAFQRSQRQVTLLVTFLDVTFAPPGYVPEPVFVNGTSIMEFPGGNTWGIGLDFIEFKRVNIRKEFFRLFLKRMGEDWQTKTDVTGDLRFTVMMLSENVGHPVCDGGDTKVYTKPVRLYTDELPDGYDDPNSPNFDPGVNGGTVTNDVGKAVPWLQSLYDLLTDLFNWKLSYAGFLAIFWTVVSVFGLAIIVTICRAIIG